MSEREWEWERERALKRIRTACFCLYLMNKSMQYCKFYMNWTFQEKNFFAFNFCLCSMNSCQWSQQMVSVRAKFVMRERERGGGGGEATSVCQKLDPREETNDIDDFLNVQVICIDLSAVNFNCRRQSKGTCSTIDNLGTPGKQSTQQIYGFEFDKKHSPESRQSRGIKRQLLCCAQALAFFMAIVKKKTKKHESTPSWNSLFQQGRQGMHEKKRKKERKKKRLWVARLIPFIFCALMWMTHNCPWMNFNASDHCKKRKNDEIAYHCSGLSSKNEQHKGILPVTAHDRLVWWGRQKGD